MGKGKQGLGGPMWTVVLNRKKRDKEHLYTYTEEVISVALQIMTTTPAGQGGGVGRSAGTDGKEKSPQGHGCEQEPSVIWSERNQPSSPYMLVGHNLIICDDLIQTSGCIYIDMNLGKQ